MKHIFYIILSVCLFQIACPSQDNMEDLVPLLQDQQHASPNGSLPSEFSVPVSARTDGLSSPNSPLSLNPLKYNGIHFEYAPADNTALDWHGTFYMLDREISSLNKKISRFKHYGSDGSQAIQTIDSEVVLQKFDLAFKNICDKVRSFQMEANPLELNVRAESMDGDLVHALLAVGAQHGLSIDYIPSPISCSFLRCPATAAAATATAGQSNQGSALGYSQDVGYSQARTVLPSLNLNSIVAMQVAAQPRNQSLEVVDVVSHGSNDSSDDLQDCVSDFEYTVAEHLAEL